MLRREVIKGVGKTDAVTPEAVASLLANDRCGGSYAQLVTTNRTEFNLLGVEDVAGIGHMAERVYEYADEGAFSGVRFRQQTALGLGRFVSAAELLGATVVGDVPLAMEHEVVNQVSKLLSVGFTDSQKSAAVAAAAVKRAALEARKKASQNALAACSSAGRIKASSLEVCRFSDGGDEHCCRSFFSKLALLEHQRLNQCSSGRFRPTMISTTRAVSAGSPAAEGALVAKPKEVGTIRERVRAWCRARFWWQRRRRRLPVRGS
jgi:hypothetical protein